MTDPLQHGDHVFIGEPAPTKVHWTIVGFDGNGWAYLQSGMTGRRTVALTSSLTLHTKGSPA